MPVAPESSGHRYPEKSTSDNRGGILVVLIHPFKREKCRASLKDWVEEESRGLVERVEDFLFSDEEILKENGAEFKADSEKLRKMVSGLLNFPQNCTRETSQRSTTTKQSKEVPRSVIWIAHGLGAWIVKDVLATDALMDDVFMNLTIGLLFLDSLDPVANLMDLPTYLNRLKQNSQRKPHRIKFRKEGNQEISRLADCLENIDRKYLRSAKQRGGFSEAREQYIQTGWLNSSSNMPKETRVSVGWQHRGELEVLRSRIFELLQGKRMPSLNEQKFPSDVFGLRDCFFQVGLRNRLFSIASKLDDKHLGKLDDLNITSPILQGAHPYGSTQMDSKAMPSHNDRYLVLEEDLDRLALEVFCVSHLEHYIEAMKGFWERQSQEITRIKQEIETDILNKGKQEWMAHDSKDYMNEAKAKVELATRGIENKIEQLKEMLKPESLGFEGSLGNDRKLKVKECRDHLATAVVEMAHGDYRQALKAVESAESGYTLYFMPEHITRLEVSSFQSLLLALNSKPMDAEQLCRRTINMMVEEQGIGHPMMLVTTSNLVHILMELSYFTSAMETAAFLIKQTTEVLGNKDPLTLRCKAQLALAKLYSGDYSDAEDILESVVRMSENCLGEVHPDMFQYQCFLAKVHLKRGKLGAARRWVNTVLEMEHMVFSGKTGENVLLVGGPTGRRVHDIISGSKAPMEQPSDCDFAQDLEAASLAKKVHPQLLELLKLRAEIMFQESTKDFGISLYKAVWLQERAQYGERQLSTARSLYRLSIMTRETQDDRETYVEVEKQLKGVIAIREGILGRFHVDTLSTRREILKTDWYLNGSEDSDISNDKDRDEDDSLAWEHICTESQFIYDTHMSHLGKYHPETLESLLWLFRVRLSHSLDQLTENSSKELLLALRSPKVHEDRLIESLDMEFSVAVIYYGFGHVQIAEEILGQVLRRVNDASSEEDEAMKDSLTMVNREVHEFLGYLKDCTSGVNESAV
ncbi:hypothetical protein K449DRAFT_431539 [Hypoxylon sp. EC38]|nr:hypothetical protein K449DRAFT_431539 [Hypoxylon sp. EC38]